MKYVWLFRENRQTYITKVEKSCKSVVCIAMKIHFTIIPPICDGVQVNIVPFGNDERK